MSKSHQVKYSHQGKAVLNSSYHYANTQTPSLNQTPSMNGSAREGQHRLTFSVSSVNSQRSQLTEESCGQKSAGSFGQQAIHGGQFPYTQLPIDSAAGSDAYSNGVFSYEQQSIGQRHVDLQDFNNEKLRQHVFDHAFKGERAEFSLKKYSDVYSEGSHSPSDRGSWYDDSLVQYGGHGESLVWGAPTPAQSTADMVGMLGERQLNSLMGEGSHEAANYSDSQPDYQSDGQSTIEFCNSSDVCSLGSPGQRLGSPGQRSPVQQGSPKNQVANGNDQLVSAVAQTYNSMYGKDASNEHVPWGSNGVSQDPSKLPKEVVQSFSKAEIGDGRSDQAYQQHSIENTMSLGSPAYSTMSYGSCNSKGQGSVKSWSSKGYDSIGDMGVNVMSGGSICGGSSPGSTDEFHDC